MAKRIAFTLLQLLVTAAGIYYVFHDSQKRSQIGHALGAADWRWLALGWVVYGAVEMIATMRWQMLLRVQGIVLSWFRTAVIVVVGLFFNMFLPGLVGGDAIRLFLLFKNVPHRKTAATLSVAMDRLLGLVSLLILALLVVVLRIGWLNQAPRSAHITYLAVTLLCGATIFALLLFALIAKSGRRRWARRLPFHHAIGRLGKALKLYRAHPRIVTGALLLTVISHITYYLSYYCALRSLPVPAADRMRMVDFLSIMPLVNTITGIPISFGGVGVRETLFQTLLGQLAHVPAAAAAPSASLGYVVQASWGVVGGLAYLFIRSREGRRNSSRSRMRMGSEAVRSHHERRLGSEV